jgi:hypothetical protein
MRDAAPSLVRRTDNGGDHRVVGAVPNSGNVVTGRLGMA